MEGATHQKDRSVFDSHEDFGDKLGLGGVKTTEVATYQTCNWLILLSRGIICKYAVSRLNAMILFPAASPPACLLSFLDIGFASKMWPNPFWSRIRAHPITISEFFDLFWPFSEGNSHTESLLKITQPISFGSIIVIYKQLQFVVPICIFESCVFGLLLYLPCPIFHDLWYPFYYDLINQPTYQKVHIFHDTLWNCRYNVT